MSQNINGLRKLNTFQLLNFCLGFFGLQFAWQMRIILSGPVTEGLGASPFIFGLIWLAGPVTGMVVQPIIGALSDNTNTKFGRRRPYLMLGAILAALALWAFPNSANIAQLLADKCPVFPMLLSFVISFIAILFILFGVDRLIGLVFKNLKSAIKKIGLFLSVPYAIWGACSLAKLLNLIVDFDGFLNLFGGLIVAAIMIWVIDACVNAAQGPYRALIPDNIEPEQHSLANSYLSFAIGLGSVIAAGTAPFLKWAFNYSMSIEAQFIMAALAFALGMTWTCVTFKERSIEKEVKNIETKEAKPSFVDNFKTFLNSSPEVYKICAMQFCTWIGVMCMFIFFTQFAVHTVYGIPDLTNATEALKLEFAQKTTDATIFSSICFAILNLICFLVSIPIGVLSTKFGNKKIHLISLITMVIAYTLMAFINSPIAVMVLMGLAGIGWASILALPFAMLSEYIQKGSEGAVMGIFNIFIAGPQIFVCTLVAWIISKCIMQTPQGINYHYEYSFIIGAIVLILAAVITSMIKENK